MPASVPKRCDGSAYGDGVTEPSETPTHLPTATAATIATGGVALAASAFFAWVAKGAGSSMSLQAVGDLVLRDRWSRIPRWFGVLAYVVPVCGGIAIVVAGLPATTARRVLRPIAGLVTALLAAVGVTLAVRTRMPSIGFVLAALGAALLLVGVVVLRQAAVGTDAGTGTGAPASD